MDTIQWISINKEVYRRGGIQRLHPPYTSNEYNRKPVRSPCTVKSFWLWIRRISTH
ncbi:hypothetical protein J4Q44_G00376380 [Coregonus suidteri]|uniref:Uncharacterized protein n=1 Tax=Coregonus suidteri TaxID=861788 RepID=A0AAN8KJI9_9TELE